MVFTTREERPELLMDIGVTNDDEAGGPPLAIDDGERRLAAAVLEHEFRCGCGTAPRRADSTAAADGLGRQPDEFFVHHLLGQILEHGCASPVRHRAASSPVNWKDQESLVPRG